MSLLLAPACRDWLRRTRLPLVRHLVQAGRLVARLKRLPHTEAVAARLEIEARNIEDRGNALEAQLRATQEQLRYFENQLDMLKSAREVPQEWFEEFRVWKRETPLRKPPCVSVCVATFNRGRLLTQRCLPSLLRQTYDNIEIVVVGDGCTDDTAERIASLGDSRLRFVNLPQRGRYPDEPMRHWQVAGTVPVNHALRLCAGDFITHLDDDDEHDPTRIAKLLAFACANDLDLVWHPFWYETKPCQWQLCPGEALRHAQVTTSSIFYRGWLARIGWDLNAHMLDEPGDWNRLRKFKYLGVKAARFPEPLLRHYAERSQLPGRQSSP